MPECFDKQIVQLQKQNRELQQDELLESDIRNGSVMIDGETVMFTTKHVLYKDITIVMPESFYPMDDAIAMFKYPYENRPAEIYTNDDTDINVTFDIEDSDLFSDEISCVRDKSIDLIQKEMPKMNLLNQGILKAQIGEIAFIEFVYQASDMDIYCIMFFTVYKNKPFIGNFSCPEYDKTEWEKLAKQMIESIAIV